MIIRIVNPDAEPRLIFDGREVTNNGFLQSIYLDGYKKSDTIPISDEEWDTIYRGYSVWLHQLDTIGYNKGHPFSQYLRELIALKEAQ